VVVTCTAATPAATARHGGTPFGVLPSGDTVHVFTLANGDVVLPLDVRPVADISGTLHHTEVAF
jgi:hypothetical protein